MSKQPLVKTIFAALAGILDYGEQLLDGHHATLGAFFALHRAAQLRRADAGGAQLADHDTGGRLASATACGSCSPAAMAAARVEMTVSPAPVTSNTSRARAGRCSGA